MDAVHLGGISQLLVRLHLSAWWTANLWTDSVTSQQSIELDTGTGLRVPYVHLIAPPRFSRDYDHHYHHHTGLLAILIVSIFVCHHPWQTYGAAFEVRAAFGPDPDP